MNDQSDRNRVSGRVVNTSMATVFATSAVLTPSRAVWRSATGALKDTLAPDERPIRSEQGVRASGEHVDGNSLRDIRRPDPLQGRLAICDRRPEGHLGPR